MFDVGCDNFLKTKHDLEEEIEEYLKTLSVFDDAEFEVYVLETNDSVAFQIALQEMFLDLEEEQIRDIEADTASEFFGEKYMNDCNSYFFELGKGE